MRNMRGLGRPGHTALAALLLSACHSLRPLPPARLNAADLPSRVWVTGSDHATVPLDAPQITGDTLAGFVHGEFREWRLFETTSIRTREVAPGRTAALAALTGVATLGVFLYLESRRDVGNGQICLNALDQRPLPYTPCCLGQDSVPC
jgi:hypothetical protein